MRVFVRRSSLTLAADEAAQVMAYFDDAATISPEMTKRPDFAVLSLPASAFRPTDHLPELMPGWRESNKATIAYGEAARRILDVFPEHSQRNSIAEMQADMTQYGAEIGQWPAEAQRRKAEVDRSWAYVAAVRGRANAMLKGALPADPTADSHWPTRASPYQPG